MKKGDKIVCINADMTDLEINQVYVVLSFAEFKYGSEWIRIDYEKGWATYPRQSGLGPYPAQIEEGRLYQKYRFITIVEARKRKLIELKNKYES